MGSTLSNPAGSSGTASRSLLPDRFTGRHAAYLFLAFWSALILLPLFVLFVFSFFQTKMFMTVYDPSLETWISLFQSGRFEVTLRTLRIALTVVAAELLIAFPFALWLAKGRSSKGTKAIFIALMTIPFFLDLSSRIIIWRSILGTSGLINWGLAQLGLIDTPVEWMLYSEFAVHFGMFVTYFPLMFLPIYMAITLIDDTMLQASADLGATPVQTLFRVLVPLSMPGILVGVMLTLGSALAAWVEPSMLGGGFVNLLSNSVESAYTALRYPVVAALSSFVIVLLIAIMSVFGLLTRHIFDLSSTFRALGD